MAILKKIILWFLVAVVALTAGIYLFLSTNGRRLFNEQASSLTNRKVTVQVIAPKLPAGVVLKGLVVEGLLSIQQVRLKIDPLALLRGRVKIVSAELSQPVLFLERGEDSRLTLPPSGPVVAPSAGASSAGRAAKSADAKARPSAVIIHDLSIVDGEIHLKDLQSGREWAVSDIEGALKDVPLTSNPVKTEFAATASLASLDIPFSGRSLKTKGWLNWAAKDMDALVQVGDEAGHLGLSATLVSKANVLQVAGHISLSPGQTRKLSGRKGGAVEDAVLGVLGVLAAKIEADFSFPTAMDRFALPEEAFPLRGKVTSELNSDKTLGSIVGEMRLVGEELVKKDASAGKEPERTK